MDNHKISLIVPVYNVENSLHKCLDSILSQTFTDWECILIDDGSTDNSSNICEAYKTKDERFLVIHKQNDGVSSARNEGIKNANGEWLAFIDSDDYVLPSYLSLLLKGTDSDFSLCGFKSAEGIDFTPSGSNSFKEALYSKYLLCTPWAKLFKRDIIVKNNLFFDKQLRLGEDSIFCYQYLLFCKSIHVVASNAYFYTGIWGGQGKYELSKEEVDYLDRKIIESFSAFNNKFNVSFDLRFCGFHASFLKNLYLDFTDYDIYLMYCSNHVVISEEKFFSYLDLSCILWSINDLLKYYQEKKYKEAYSFIGVLYRFYTLPTRLFKTHPFIVRLLHFLIKHKLFLITHILGISYGTLHKFRY